MLNIFEKVVTGFFVLFFAVLWFLSIRHYERPSQYKIISYDLLGNECSLDGVRISFHTKEVATSFTKQYNKTFPQFTFSMRDYIPQKSSRKILSILKL